MSTATHPLLTAADQVRRANARTWAHHTPKLPSPLLRAADQVRLPATEHDLLFEGQLDGLLFEGATRAKLRIISDVFCGMPVEYLTANNERDGRGWETGVFLGITMPGDWHHTPFESAYDLKIATAWHRDGTACSSGATRVLGIGAVRGLRALAQNRWGICQQCGSWRPNDKLTYAYTEFTDDEDRRLNASTKECRNVGPSGWCA